VSKHWPWALAAVVLLGTAGSNRDAFDERGAVLFAVFCAFLAVIPAVFGAAHHVSLAVSGVWSAAYFAIGFADGPIFLALPAVILTVAQRESVRRWAPWALGATTLNVAAILWNAYHETDPGRDEWQAFGTAAIALAAGAFGTMIRTRRAANLDRTQRAATEERLRMAQDLHDGVGHGLAVIAMQAGAALHVLDQDPAKARENLEAIRATSKESLDALRAELAQMSGDPGARRPAPGLDQLDGLLDRVRSGGLVVECTGSVSGIGEAVSRTAYAVVQEALTNVLRHAQATHARVSFERRGERLLLTIADDGHGGPPTGQNEGMGISGMRSRIEAAGGTLTVGPGAGGWRVRAILPDES
jgi:signal transduction histidine kinase